MTSQPSISRVPVELPDDYKCPDAQKPDVLQSPTINKAAYFIARHFGGRSETLVRSHSVVQYDPDDLGRWFEPGLFVAFGIDVEAAVKRNGYIAWELGKPPDLILDVAAFDETARDVEPKRRLYAGLGVKEYWRVDPTGGEVYGFPLAGDMLVNGEYRAIPMENEPDGMTWGYSPALDLFPCWNPAWDWDADDEVKLRFYNRSTRRYLCDMTLVERELAALKELEKLRAIWRPDTKRILHLLEEQLRRQQP